MPKITTFSQSLENILPLVEITWNSVLGESEIRNVLKPYSRLLIKLINLNKLNFIF